ncbi:MAG: DegT/DnrJ/EryC1/StrS aminotransferase family protein, partial [Nitrospirae bacterium]|nr:DegT/DnrJ/EryC1/StrS aminotransferase family protein [Nitrospirota bacterium]
GKNAFWYIAKMIRLQIDDEVIVPAYMCYNALQPLMKAGARFRFIDIGIDLKIDFRSLVDLFTNKTKLLILVQYFGMPTDIREIVGFAQSQGVHTVEDCALSYGSIINGRFAGTTADFGLFSLRKFFPIPDGGMLLDNRNNISDIKREGINMGKGLAIVRSMLSNAESKTGVPFVKYLKGSKGELLNDSIVNGEGDFELGISNVSMGILEKQEPWEDICLKRRENYKYMLIGLEENTLFKPLRKTLEDGFCPMTLPLMVDSADSADSIRDKLNQDRVPAYAWPGVSNLHPYVRENIKKYPITQYLVNNLIMLPVHQDLTKRHLDYMIQVLTRDF